VRPFLALLALALSHGIAIAQSDTRKVAIFYTNGGSGTTGLQSTQGTAETAEANSIVQQLLDGTGTPYTVFLYTDSAGGWASTMGATRPAGMSDAEWFRQNGYLGVVEYYTGVSTAQTLEHIRFFTDGVTRGTQASAPASGLWDMPCVAFTTAANRNAGAGFESGVWTNFADAAPNAIANAFANGDTLAFTATTPWRLDPSQAANVTVILHHGDSLATGTATIALKYKNNYSMWYAPSFTRPTTAILALAQMFRDAGYTPRRKLGLHWTLDHIYPDRPNVTAPSDSFLHYVTTYGWRLSAAIKAHGLERVIPTDDVKARWNAAKQHFPSTPHSHVDGVGNYFQGTAWNFSTYADTNIIRGRWNFLERAISDTMGLVLARGYERVAAFPGDGIHYPHLYILAQNGYTDFRAPSSDSIGHATLSSKKRVYFSPPTAAHGAGLNNPRRPFRYTEPVTGKAILIHGQYSHPGSSDTTWSQIASEFGNSVNGKAAHNMNNIAKAILADADYYWHPNQNLEGETLTGTNNMPISLFVRRFVYFWGRVNNIVEVSPSYKTAR
jgi:hypothetical protein